MYLKLRHFMKTVTTAGTSENLTSSDKKVPFLKIYAKSTNGDAVYVGDTAVSSTSYAHLLNAGDAIELNAKEYGDGSAFISMKDIWVDVGLAGDGVAVSYLERS